MSYDSIFRRDAFDNGTIIVTGAGSGIGRCVAHELSSLGAAVVLVGRTQAKLDAVAQEIEEDGGRALAIRADIRVEDEVREAVRRAVEWGGPIAGLVNNAGGQYRSSLQDMSTKGFDAVVRTNLTGGFTFMREVLTQSMREHGGSIVNIIADIWFGLPHFGHTGAARGGMLTLTETAATEWAEFGVRVNAVAPGSIASSGLDTYEPADDKFLNRDLTHEVPLQRWGTEAEVSAAIVFLLTQASAYITGTCVRVDGGAPNSAGGLWPAPAIRNHRPYKGFHRSVPPAVLSQVPAD